MLKTPQHPAAAQAKCTATLAHIDPAWEVSSDMLRILPEQPLQFQMILLL